MLGKRQLRLPWGQISPKGSVSEFRGSPKEEHIPSPSRGQRMCLESQSLSTILFELELVREPTDRATWEDC